MQEEVRNANYADYNTITDFFHLPLIIQRAVQNHLVCLCIHKIHIYFCHVREVCDEFGGGGLDHSFLKIHLMTAFFLTIPHSGNGLLFECF